MHPNGMGIFRQKKRERPIRRPKARPHPFTAPGLNSHQGYTYLQELRVLTQFDNERKQTRKAQIQEKEERRKAEQKIAEAYHFDMMQKV